MHAVRCILYATSMAIAFPTAAAAQGVPGPHADITSGSFVEVIPTEGRAPVWIAAAQVVRVARVEGYTVVDTSAWVQQRTVEPVEVVARRLREAGQRLVALTDLSNARTYLAADRFVLVRDSHERHAVGARAAIVLVGLRFNSDVAVRETVEEVMAALKRDSQRR